jgi:hypothetical protein
MASSGMLRRVALVRTDVSEERIPSIIGVTRIGELGTLARLFFCIFSGQNFVFNDKYYKYHLRTFIHVLDNGIIITFSTCWTTNNYSILDS